MEIVNSSVTIIKPDTILGHLERIGRVCYKSEDKIGPGTAEKFIKGIVNKGHEAMIEHHIFVAAVDSNLYHSFLNMKPDYVNMTATMVYEGNDSGMRYIISGSARSFKDLYKATDSRYERDIIYSVIYKLARCNNTKVLFEGIPVHEKVMDSRVDLLDEKFVKSLTLQERMVHQFMTVHIICDRGISHELVRHRRSSFAQESTRYVNYGDSDIKFIDIRRGMKLCHKMDGLSMQQIQQIFEIWSNAVGNTEIYYDAMINAGAPPEIARSVLPNSLKTEIIVTAVPKQWRHIFGLRGEKFAHPQMREIIIPLYEKCRRSEPDLYGNSSNIEQRDIETIDNFNIMITEG